MQNNDEEFKKDIKARYAILQMLLDLQLEAISQMRSMRKQHTEYIFKAEVANDKKPIKEAKEYLVYIDQSLEKCIAAKRDQEEKLRNLKKRIDEL